MSVKPIKVGIWEAYLKEHPKFTGCLIDKDNDKAWCLYGKYRITDGPAIQYHNGSKEWWLNGEYH